MHKRLSFYTADPRLQNELLRICSHCSSQSLFVMFGSYWQPDDAMKVFYHIRPLGRLKLCSSFSL